VPRKKRKWYLLAKIRNISRDSRFLQFLLRTRHIPTKIWPFSEDLLTTIIDNRFRDVTVFQLVIATEDCTAPTTQTLSSMSAPGPQGCVRSSYRPRFSRAQPTRIQYPSPSVLFNPGTVGIRYEIRWILILRIAMCNHKRLGSDSAVRSFPDELLIAIFEHMKCSAREGSGDGFLDLVGRHGV
jgi:hypothetical protein